MTQLQRAEAFQDLHRQPGLFMVANPWDTGSARLLASLGFPALASTSAGAAAAWGEPDYGVDRDRMLAHLRELAAATDLPLSADLEDGYGSQPEDVAETIRLAAATGVVGASIEDIDRHRPGHCLPLAVAVERVKAAVDAARQLPFPFTLTARTENFMLGNPDLADTVRRLQAYQEAGADVLYAPAVKRTTDLAHILSQIERPLNVLVGVPGFEPGIAGLEAMGVRRLSVGSALARVAYSAMLQAAAALFEGHDPDYAAGSLSYTAFNQRLRTLNPSHPDA